MRRIPFINFHHPLATAKKAVLAMVSCVYLFFVFSHCYLGWRNVFIFTIVSIIAVIRTARAWGPLSVGRMTSVLSYSSVWRGSMSSFVVTSWIMTLKVELKRWVVCMRARRKLFFSWCRRSPSCRRSSATGCLLMSCFCRTCMVVVSVSMRVT